MAFLQKGEGNGHIWGQLALGLKTLPSSKVGEDCTWGLGTHRQGWGSVEASGWGLRADVCGGGDRASSQREDGTVCWRGWARGLQVPPLLCVPCSLQMVHSFQPLTWVVQAAERPPPTDLLIQEAQVPSHETPVSPNLSRGKHPPIRGTVPTWPQGSQRWGRCLIPWGWPPTQLGLSALPPPGAPPPHVLGEALPGCFFLCGWGVGVHTQHNLRQAQAGLPCLSTGPEGHRVPPLPFEAGGGPGPLPRLSAEGGSEGPQRRQL